MHSLKISFGRGSPGQTSDWGRGSPCSLEPSLPLRIKVHAEINWLTNITNLALTLVLASTLLTLTLLTLTLTLGVVLYYLFWVFSYISEIVIHTDALPYALPCGAALHRIRCEWILNLTRMPIACCYERLCENKRLTRIKLPLQGKDEVLSGLVI